MDKQPSASNDRMYLGPPEQHSGHDYRAEMTMAVTGSDNGKSDRPSRREKVHGGVLRCSSADKYGKVRQAPIVRK